MKQTLIFILQLVLIKFAFAQETNEKIDTLRRDALKVFFDCKFCDEDYIRREVSFINYVRDRKEAQVHLMITSQRTASRGTEYTFHFLGQNEFKSQNDTLKYVSSTDNTREEIRKGQTDLMKLGLMRYVAKTPLANHIQIRFNQPEKEEIVEDKWRSWVFRTRLSGSLNEEKSYKYHNLSGSFSASKVTPEWKWNFNTYYSYSESKFDINGDTTYTSERKNKSFSSLGVKSLGEHWSMGGMLGVSSSIYRNYKLRFYFRPAIEYNIFPYSESTRKQLRILYTAGYACNHYEDTTIYDKVKESLYGHDIDISLQVTQKWGSIYASLEWLNYFHDWSKNNLSLFGSINIRITKGLEFNIGGGASLIHDQLSLVKGGSTKEEILLRRREIETQYSFSTRFSITYTFGSIYSNIVNPRFGGDR